MLLDLHLIEEPIGWLSSLDIALWSVIIANIWIGISFNMLLLSTELSSLPQDVDESASLDGANWWQKLVHITLPLLKRLSWLYYNSLYSNKNVGYYYPLFQN